MLLLLTLILELTALYLLATFIFKKISLVFVKLFRSKRLMMYVLAILFLPGTLIHEMAHWLVATLLFVPTGKMTLWPEFLEHGIKMGSVQIAKTDFVRKTLIGLAPILVGTAIIILGLYLITQNNLLANTTVVIVAGILVFQISNTMFSSQKDLEGSWIFFVFLFAILLAFYLLGVEVNINLEPILTPATKFLLVPISLDLLLVLILKII